MQKEYIEREALLNSFEELINIACEQGSPRIGKAMRTGTCAGIAFCRNEVRHAPAADVVEVVRCKDCKYSGMYCFGTSKEETLACLEIEEDGFIRFATATNADGYCSCGERKMDKEE